jgi:RNA polymerase sigma-70 factor (ECF subfamily)
MQKAKQGCEDLLLVEALRRGCEQSFEILTERYSGKVMQLATRMMRNQEDAEEVLQDVFVTVYRKINAFEGKSSFSSWLYRITVNSALMLLRKKRSKPTQALEDAVTPELLPEALRSSEEQGTDRPTLRNQILIALEKAIGSLPEEYQPVFVLRDIDGLSSTEVGKILNISVPAVKSRLHRSRVMLRKELQCFYDEFRQQGEGNSNLVSNG